MIDRDDGPQIVVPPKLRRQLRVADAGIAGLLALAAAAFAWAVTHPGQTMAPPEIQPEFYWVPVPPIHDGRMLAAAMAAAFGTVLACYLDPAHPLARWAARKLNRPELAGEHGWLRGTVTPAFQQARLRAAALVAGVVGIALWHFGLDGIEVLRSSAPAVWILGIVAAGLLLTFDVRRAFRFALSMVPAFLAYQAGVAAAGWALAAVSVAP